MEGRSSPPLRGHPHRGFKQRQRGGNDKSKQNQNESKQEQPRFLLAKKPSNDHVPMKTPMILSPKHLHQQHTVERRDENSPQHSTSTISITAAAATAPGEIKLLRATPHALLLQQPQAQPFSLQTILQQQQAEEKQQSVAFVSAPPTPSPQTVKLMSCTMPTPPPYYSKHHYHQLHVQQQFEICLENCDRILSEYHDYCVIGVLGQEGVGKSFVMSSLGQGSSSSGSSFKPIFSQQNANHIIEFRHETNGIDMYLVNCDESNASSLGVILLDVQPLFSTSIINDWITKDAKLDNDVMNYENYMDLLSIQLGLFLFSVCHVVLVTMDSFSDVKMLKYIQTLRMLQKGIPNILSHQQSHAQQPEPVGNAAEGAVHANENEQEKITAITSSGYMIHEYVPDIGMF